MNLTALPHPAVSPLDLALERDSGERGGKFAVGDLADAVAADRALRTLAGSRS